MVVAPWAQVLERQASNSAASTSARVPTGGEPPRWVRGTRVPARKRGADPPAAPAPAVGCLRSQCPGARGQPPGRLQRQFVPEHQRTRLLAPARVRRARLWGWGWPPATTNPAAPARRPGAALPRAFWPTDRPSDRAGPDEAAGAGSAEVHGAGARRLLGGGGGRGRGRRQGARGEQRVLAAPPALLPPLRQLSSLQQGAAAASPADPPARQTHNSLTAPAAAARSFTSA